MSVIYLVRHGQASFGRANYDELSPLGEEQARVTGAAFLDRGIRPDVMVTGQLQRQQVTGSRMWESAGWDAPVHVDSGWDEYDHDAIVAGYKPAYRNRAVLNADMARHRHPYKWFQQMFVEATWRWVSGEHDEDYPETFAQFRDRVTLALGRVTSGLERGQNAVVVSSGGPMAWVAASLLTASTRPAPDETPLPAPPPEGAAAAWINLNQVMVNANITSVLAGRTLTAYSINDHSHLVHDERLVTYR